MSTQAPMTVSEAARHISDMTGANITPRHISELFYNRKLRDDLAPIVGGRRLIPNTMLDAILIELRRAGRIPFSIA